MINELRNAINNSNLSDAEKVNLSCVLAMVSKPDWEMDKELAIRNRILSVMREAGRPMRASEIADCGIQGRWSRKLSTNGCAASIRLLRAAGLVEVVDTIEETIHVDCADGYWSSTQHRWVQGPVSFDKVIKVKVYGLA